VSFHTSLSLQGIVFVLHEYCLHFQQHISCFFTQFIQMKSILIPLLLSTMIGHSQAQTCVATASMTVTINDNCSKLAPKAFLQGPYNATLGMMNDHLRTASLIPTTSPQDAATTAPASVVNNPTNTLLNTNPDAIVDWVLVELRDKTNPATIKGSAAALVQRDGDIVAVDGVSPVVVNVPALTTGYYVAIKHRNHLGAMTGTAMPMLAGATAVVDFTTMGNGATAATGSVGQSWGFNSQKFVGSKFCLLSGNSDGDGRISAIDYNDFWLLQNGKKMSAFGYLNIQSDYDLDGRVTAIDYNDFWLLNNGRKQTF
jgi:hypothetical protein